MIGTLVIGAGPSGLCAAKTLLQIDPDADVVLLEARPSLGGVWSREQLYPTLRTNNLHGTLDFTDFPMDPSRFGVRPGEHVPGDAMYAYFAAYADHFGLTGRIRFNTRVLEVWRLDLEEGGVGGGWMVTVAARKNPDAAAAPGRERDREDVVKTLECSKLVVATGVLDTPRLPDLPGLAEFDAPYIHSVNLGPQADALFGSIAPTPPTSINHSKTERHDNTVGPPPPPTPRKTICVIGGSKSAYDAVYLACSRGHAVEWVIRRSGRGPHWVFPTHTYLGPIRAWREALIRRRFFAFMSPWSLPDYSGVGWMRRFLHGTGAGRLITRAFWAAIHHDTLRDCEFKTHPALNALEPEHGPFWYGTASGTLNYESDIHEFVRTGQARVHREDISHLSRRAIHFRNDASLQIDALVASTGYASRPTIKFAPASTHSGLGVPTTSLDPAQRSFWASLDARADTAIGLAFPRLVAGPPQSPAEPSPRNRKQQDTPAPLSLNGSDGVGGREVKNGETRPAEPQYTPWRLYRGIAPPGLTAQGDRSLVFVGMISNIANTIRLEVQCLWAAAYLHDKLPIGNSATGPSSLPSSATEAEAAKQVFEDTALLQRFSAHRTPLGNGGLYPDLNFDQLPYWDVLLHDLGLETSRKRGMLREIFEAYTQDDYRGMVDEWMVRNKQ